MPHNWEREWAHNGAATAFVLKDVRQAVVVEAEVGGVPVVLAALELGLPVVAFERRVQGRALHFTCADVAEPALEDAETHSRWRASDGQATDGPLTGERLTRVAAYPAFWFGWYGFVLNPLSGVRPVEHHSFESKSSTDLRDSVGTRVSLSVTACSKPLAPS